MITAETLRAAIKRADEQPGCDHSLALIVTTPGPLPRGLGVRPRLLERRPNGTRIWGFSLKQTRFLLEQLNATHSGPASPTTP
jgi:hypothetical protein